MSDDRGEVAQRYRLRCGDKLYSDWTTDLEEVWKIALREGLAYRHPSDDSAGLGPLTRIERDPE